MLEIKSDSQNFPPSLQTVEEPPSVLCCDGDASRLTAKQKVAIVGSRAATPYGLGIAFRIAKLLSENGVVVVSGFAKGIDAAAHRGALEGKGGTIAVLGCGLDIDYPRHRRELREKFLAGPGLILTEFSPGTEALPQNFPKRNRLISGLSDFVIVVEGTKRSGSLVTAQWALSQGKEVLAVPGNITSPQSEGTNYLIQNGATPLLSVEEVLPFVGIPIVASKKKSDPFLELLIQNGRTIDELVEESGFPASEVSSRLLSLELRGLVENLPGGKFAAKESHG